MTNELSQKEQSLHYKHSSERRQKQKLCRTAESSRTRRWTAAKKTNKGFWVAGKLEYDRLTHTVDALQLIMKLYSLPTMTKRKNNKGRQGGMPKWNPAHATVIKHGKHWLGYPIVHFDFPGAQMRKSLQRTARCLVSSCPLTLLVQFNVKIVLLLHLKSPASASDMIYWAGKSGSSRINLGFSVSPSAAPQQSPAICAPAELWSIFHKIPSLACTHTDPTH